MHCPRCGQQQVSEQTKFCSRCGFQLGLVSELLQNGGFLPQLNELYKEKKSLFSSIFTRKNGIVFSVIWFIFWVMLIPSFFGIANEEDAAGVSAVFGLFTTMMFLILSLAVLKRAPKRYEVPQSLPAQQAASLYGHQPMGALPPQQTQPATSYMPPEGSWRAPDTGDLARRPGSVTEGTTKLLQKDE
ncbi:MAG TPA: zinc ribbon domain-containing protein [Pyrinomonadaceae bacterium]|nr:zinc ribbon domain-containing protein [Pyrinomonadaceae bacterium]